MAMMALRAGVLFLEGRLLMMVMMVKVVKMVKMMMVRMVRMVKMMLMMTMMMVRTMVYCFRKSMRRVQRGRGDVSGKDAAKLGLCCSAGRQSFTCLKY